MPQGTFDQAILPAATSLEALNSFIQSQNPLLLLLGDDAQLCKNYTAKISHYFRRNYKIINLQAHPKWQPLRFIRLIAKLTNTKLQSTAGRLEDQLQMILQTLTARHKRYVIVIHNAEQLNYAVLAAISHLASLQENTAVQVNILLVGNSELPTRLSSVRTREIPCIQLNQLEQLPAATTTQNFADFLQAVKNWLWKIDHDNNSSTTQPSGLGKFTLVWQRHAVKMLSGAGLVVAGLCMLWLRQHPLWQSQHKIYFAKTNHSILLQQRQQAKLSQPQVIPTAKSSHILITMDESSAPAKSTLKKPPAKYALQLMASHRQQVIEKHIHQFHLENTARNLAIKSKTQAWHVLLLGHYSNIKAAKKALQHLPNRHTPPPETPQPPQLTPPPNFYQGPKPYLPQTTESPHIHDLPCHYPY